MEDLLRILSKDAQAAKFQPIRQAAANALETLADKDVDRLPVFMLRERCLEPLHLALESKTKRLMTHAVSGLEKMLKDQRFQSTLEPENEEKWLPLQILNTVYSTPNLPEEIQTDVMKLLLKMTLSSTWCMNAKIVTKISQVYIDTYTVSTNMCTLRGLVQAALTQLLGNFSEKLCVTIQTGVHADQAEQHDVMSDFNAKGENVVETLLADVVALLLFLNDKVNLAMKSGQSKQAIPLLLEGILAIIVNSPKQLRDMLQFQQLVWQNLCPTLISVMGLPKTDSKMKATSDPSKNMESPHLSPTTAKIIYSISVEICKMLGSELSLRPVLESLFHRMLLCSSPHLRHDAIKAVKELLSEPGKLVALTVTLDKGDNSTGKSANKTNDLTLVKMIVDSIKECCHTSDSLMCFTCVMSVVDLLTSIQQLDRGSGINPPNAQAILDKYSLKPASTLGSCGRSTSLVSRSDSDEAYEDSNISNSLNNGTAELDKESDNNVAEDDTKSEPAEPESGQVKERSRSKSEACQRSRLSGNHPRSRSRSEGRSRTPECDNDVQFVDRERQSAERFIGELTKLIPQLLTLYSVSEVDEALQQFASSHSDKESNVEIHVSSQGNLNTLLNADSIYCTSYAVLSLCLRLHTNDFYTCKHRHLIPCSESQFQDSVLDTDMFLYLSPDWLSHVYQTVLKEDMLASQTGTPLDDSIPLISSLKDIDGEGSHVLGGQMMRDSTSCEFEESATMGTSPEAREAGKLLAGRILSTCWDGILDVLSTVLSGKSVIGVTNAFAVMLGTDGAKEETLRKRDALCKCLDGLQTAAKLCCSLGLQDRCESVLTLLANTSCVMEDFIHATQTTPTDKSGPKSALLPQSKQKLVTLHAAHVLSMDAMMTTGLEIGSHSVDCWKQVFRCCAFISELEHTYFSRGNNQSNLPRIQQEQADKVADDLHMDNGDDLYSVSTVPVVPVAPRINVSNLVRQSGIESGWDRARFGAGELNSIQASQALCGLSQEVERLFEEAASNLNMTALMGFLSSLCEASKHQLHKVSRKMVECEDHPGERASMPVNCLHLYRLQGVLMKVAHSSRPLIHVIKAWSMVSAYLVESAGHKDRSISKLAVTCVHDFIFAVMSKQAELNHFHTNEMLCKTFENILCLELCDGDVQDQIVCSICELVEASASDIKSGWRPLFGALRAVRIEYTTVEEINVARQRHVEAVLDVFDVYLNTDNILVFANATVDCILCLLKYVRGPGEFDDSDSDDSDSEMEYLASRSASENLCLPALQYLKQCSIILQSMWKMPACPIFHGAKRIQVDTANRCVDPVIANMDFKKFARYFIPDYAGDEGRLSSSHDNGKCSSTDTGKLSSHDQGNLHKEVVNLTEEKGGGDSASLLSSDSGILIPPSKDCEETRQDGCPATEQQTVSRMVHLEELDNHTGILHVWFLLLEGVSGAISQCPRSYQPHTMETLFDLLRASSHVPGTDFVVYCIKHLLLPMLQMWLRSGSRKFGYWESGATNFKQCCGHTTDLIVDLIHDFKDDSVTSGLLETVLRQLLSVLTECVAQPTEVISRLGCSCIRHVLLSGHGDFTESMWQIIINGLEGALDVTTYSIRQLMLLFHANSENFYGDIGQVKVATRKDCTMMEFVRMWHLSQQVFLLDSQVSVELPVVDNTEDKSYVFLLYPPGYENSLNPDHIIARVPFRNIVVGLLSHQLLLQTVGCILLEGNSMPTNSMPGMLSQLSTQHVTQLLGCLRSSYYLACEFDLRPGLKFLVQKVAHTPVAVNLYKQAGAAMVFYIHTLIKICSNVPNLTQQSVCQIFAKNKNTKSLENDYGSDSSNEKRMNTSENGATTQPNGPGKGMIETVSDSTDRNDQDITCNGNKSTSSKSSDGSGDIEAEVESHGDHTKETNNINGQSEGTMSGEVSKHGENKDADTLTQSEYNSTTKEVIDVCTAKGAASSQFVVDLTAPGVAIADNAVMFLQQLRNVCEELCQTYMDILYDKSGTSCVDDMADQQLFFLIAQPDEFPEIPASRVDVNQLSKTLEETQARLEGHSLITQAVSVQETDDEVFSKSATTKPEPPVLPLVDETETKSKRERRSENESRVYNLATDKLIKNLMTEYKKRKNQNAMPNFLKSSKKEKVEKCKKKSSHGDPVEEVIEQQQQTSIMKDSEAHLQSWAELVCTILGLFYQLDDNKFTTLLPTVFGSINQMICHAHDMRLRKELAQWLHRVGVIFNVASPDMD